MNHVFGPYSLYPDRAELAGPTGLVRLEPKAFAVLRLLVENHDRVVSRHEMIEVVWGGRFVSDAAVSTALLDWESAPRARTCHKEEDHFVPLFAALGAAEGETAKMVYNDPSLFGGVSASSYRIG